MGVDFMEDAPIKPVHKAAGDWFDFRLKHPDLGIGKTGEDGSLADWQALMRKVGQDTLATAVIEVRKGTRKGDRIWFAAVLAAIPGDNHDQGATGVAGDKYKATKRSRRDLLVWCITHSPRCYADAVCTYRDDDDETTSRVPIFGMVTRRKRIRLEPESRYQALIQMAEQARETLYRETGVPAEDKWRTTLYHTVTKDRQLLAWLQSQRLIP